MTTAELTSVFGIAEALWPGDFPTGSRAVQTMWGRTLGQFPHGPACKALEKLAAREVKVPSLAVIVAAIREQIAAESPRLAEGRRPHWTEQPPGLRVVEAQRAVGAMRRELREEAEAFAARYSVPDGWLETRLAEIAVVGPMEQRALRLMAGEDAREEQAS